MSEKIVSKKGEAFSKLVRAVRNPVDRKVVPVSVNVPLELVATINKISRHLKTTRTAVIVMLLEAVIAEAAVEGGEELDKLFGKAAGRLNKEV